MATKQEAKLAWYVYVSDFNRDEIKTFNIFDHYTFTQYCAKFARKKDITKEEFAKELAGELLYYYGYKCEWEIIISDMFDDKGKTDTKIDVRKQVMLNFDVFVDYVWENRKLLIKLARDEKRKMEDRKKKYNEKA